MRRKTCRHPLKHRNTLGRCMVCARNRSKLWRRANPEKAASKSKEWRKANPERQRAILSKHYGYPTPTRPLSKICECCGRAPGKRALGLDHDHDTGQFRGWLCDNCNRGIGMLGDTLLGAQHAVEYLTRAASSVVASDVPGVPESAGEPSQDIVIDEAAS